MAANSPTHIIYKEYESPAGTLVIASCDDSLCMVDWKASARHLSNLLRLRKFPAPSSEIICGDSEVIKATISQLSEYFEGSRRSFDLKLSLCGTELQREVLAELCKINYARTISYSQLATALGRPNAVRAVAGACGSNMISIIIPCHRVIGSNGDLTGYAGSITTKRLLLDLEKKNNRDHM